MISASTCQCQTIDWRLLVHQDTGTTMVDVHFLQIFLLQRSCNCYTNVASLTKEIQEPINKIMRYNLVVLDFYKDGLVVEIWVFL